MMTITAAEARELVGKAHRKYIDEINLVINREAALGAGNCHYTFDTYSDCFREKIIQTLEKELFFEVREFGKNRIRISW